MAYFKFVDAIAHDRPIEVYNHGKMKRDFTYIDDIVEGIIRLLDHLPQRIAAERALNSKACYKIYNIGNHSPVELLTFIEVIEKALGKTAEKNHETDAARGCGDDLRRCRRSHAGCRFQTRYALGSRY